VHWKRLAEGLTNEVRGAYRSGEHRLA